jgi:glycerol-3-phosphate acyltransferase PlsX
VRIALDAMGGDDSPRVPVEAALAALGAHPELEIALVGPETELRTLVKRKSPDQALHSRLRFVPADQVIAPDESPVRAFRNKERSSLRVAIEYVKSGAAEGTVSCGSTGALMAGGLLTLGRVKGVSRPAIATMLPTFAGEGFLMLDLGAHMEADAENLVQYAIMGLLYAESILGMEDPRLGLLNVGEESSKGRELYKRAHARLSELPFNFVGNIEARVLLERKAEVVVCDGFVGNVVLKLMEAIGAGIAGLLKKELKRDWRSKFGGLLAGPALRRVFQELDYQEYGGAQLLGLRQPVVKCHGSAEPRAVQQGIHTAVQISKQKVPALIEAKLAEYQEG